MSRPNLTEGHLGLLPRVRTSGRLPSNRGAQNKTSLKRLGWLQHTSTHKSNENSNKRGDVRNSRAVKAWTDFARSNLSIVGSNSTRILDVCLRFFLCSHCWRTIQGIPLSVNSHNFGFSLNVNRPENLMGPRMEKSGRKIKRIIFKRTDNKTPAKWSAY
jgi:hypothetical protein